MHSAFWPPPFLTFALFFLTALAIRFWQLRSIIKQIVMRFEQLARFTLTARCNAQCHFLLTFFNSTNVVFRMYTSGMINILQIFTSYFTVLKKKSNPLHFKRLSLAIVKNITKNLRYLWRNVMLKIENFFVNYSVRFVFLDLIIFHYSAQRKTPN